MLRNRIYSEGRLDGGDLEIVEEVSTLQMQLR